MSSWHRQYRGRRLGRILHFLYHYCGFDVAERAQVGQNEITYQGKRIATFEFLSDTDIPYFTFLPNMSYSGTDMQAYYEQNQKTKWAEAIRDGEDTKPEPCQECRNLKIRMQIFGVPLPEKK